MNPTVLAALDLVAKAPRRPLCTKCESREQAHGETQCRVCLEDQEWVLYRKRLYWHQRYGKKDSE